MGAAQNIVCKCCNTNISVTVQSRSLNFNLEHQNDLIHHFDVLVYNIVHIRLFQVYFSPKIRFSCPYKGPVEFADCSWDWEPVEN